MIIGTFVAAYAGINAQQQYKEYYNHAVGVYKMMGPAWVGTKTEPSLEDQGTVWTRIWSKHRPFVLSGSVVAAIGIVLFSVGSDLKRSTITGMRGGQDRTLNPEDI